MVAWSICFVPECFRMSFLVILHLLNKPANVSFSLLLRVKILRQPSKVQFAIPAFSMKSPTALAQSSSESDPSAQSSMPTLASQPQPVHTAWRAGLAIPVACHPHDALPVVWELQSGKIVKLRMRTGQLDTHLDRLNPAEVASNNHNTRH